MRIVFTRDYTVQAEGGPSYRKGQTEEVSEASAAHFVNRGAAEVVTNDTPKPKPEPTPEPAPAPKPRTKKPRAT